MHSYTHGGLNQVTRRIKSSTIEPVIDEKEIDELICFSELISFLSFCEMIEMSKVRSCKNEVLKSMMEGVFNECFNRSLEVTYVHMGVGSCNDTFEKKLTSCYL
jgi:hypothetical protein